MGGSMHQCHQAETIVPPTISRWRDQNLDAQKEDIKNKSSLEKEGRRKGQPGVCVILIVSALGGDAQLSMCTCSDQKNRNEGEKSQLSLGATQLPVICGKQHPNVNCT